MAESPKQKLQLRLGKRCKALRLEREYSQLDIIRNFDFSLSHYQKLERGALDARLSTLAKLAEVFNLTLSELLSEV